MSNNFIARVAFSPIEKKLCEITDCYIWATHYLRYRGGRAGCHLYCCDRHAKVAYKMLKALGIPTEGKI